MTIPSIPAWWDAKFRDLPLLTIPSYQYPKHDGDMALLSELADRVFCHTPAQVRELHVQHIYHRTCHSTGIYPMQILRSLRKVCGDE